MMQPEVREYQDLEECSRAAAALIVAKATSCVQQRGFFTLALTGGRTPGRLYELLAHQPSASRMPWDETHIFWGDDRWVPHTHPASNFGLARDTLLAKVKIPPANIHPIPTNLASPQISAETYEARILDFFRSKSGNEHQSDQRLPATPIDLILLGMGEDGHIASLFPGHDFAQDRNHLVLAINTPDAKPPVPRVSMSLKLINQADTILFLVSGEKKKRIVQEILTAAPQMAKIYPAAQIRPTTRLLWLLAG